MNYNLRFAYEFLKSQNLKYLDMQNVRDILFKQGFKVSYIEDTKDYNGQAESLPVFRIADVAITDIQNKNIYISKELDENHSLYLLCAELYKILYGHRHQTALDITQASHIFAVNLQRLTGTHKLWWSFISRPLLPIITTLIFANAAAIALLLFGMRVGTNLKGSLPTQVHDIHSDAISFDDALIGYPIDEQYHLSGTSSYQVSAFDKGNSSSLDFVSELLSSQSQEDIMSDNDTLTKIQNQKANDSNELQANISAENTTASDGQSGIIYYVTKSGKKYHTQNCSYVTGKDSLKEVTIDIISIKGYSPRSKCIE